MSDLRLAVRSLLATPVVSGVAVLSLALGIGANTAIFSLVNSLLLRTLPVRDPSRLVLLTEGVMTRPRAWSNPVWEAIRERPALFERAASWSFTRFNLNSGGETSLVDGVWTSGAFFDTLGVSALLGRTLSDADDRPNGADGPVAVISYAFWQRHFGGAADAVGRSMHLDDVSFTIAGIMPPDFFGAEVGRAFDVAVPLAAEPMLRGRDSAVHNGGTTFLTVIARLRRDESAEAATAALRAVQPQIREATLGENGQGQFATRQSIDRYLTTPFALLPAATGASDLRLRYERPLLTILVVAALVLLIACANIANLSLARATARRHELSLRLALGASRWRLVRQLLTESLVLSTTGALFGMAIAAWSSRVLVRQISTSANTVFLDLSIDWHVLAFTAGIAALTTMCFGTAPAFHTSGVAPMDALKEHGRATVGPTCGATTDWLVVVQVALSLVLLVAAGLFIRTFLTLRERPLGFSADHVLLVGVDASRTMVDPAERLPIYERGLAAVRALPGVAAAALSLTTPIGTGQFTPRMEMTEPPVDTQGPVWANLISPGWFATFGTPLVAGRDLTNGDRKGAPRVAVVNQAFARRLVDGNPIGRTFTLYPRTARSLGPIEIVGVVGDAVYTSVRAPAPPTYYLPLPQFDYLAEIGIRTINLSIRTGIQSPTMLTRSVATALAAENPQVTLTFRALSDQVSASLTQERVVAMLAGFFGALALLLAGLGLYGVTSYAVSRRRTEIGIRMALGAAPAGVVRLVLARVTMLVAIGVLVGAAVSVWAAKFVATLLYGLQPRDPVTIVAAVLVLGTVGAVAGWVPAYRASRIDPAEVLRDA